ncbi:hypothetical protein D0869_15326 [Hortaea werneckii]|uniref:RGS domain-containing protein n=2 Tax=Hortaea werneckii TaxID=91943 RepID=A0A3M6XTJ4_HORWE|nr:hypothetical protein D0869_15326 [Hortaea werneckii]RMX79219.1 hypothetical protein D0867_16508 [Hortaea werneckii]RMX94113.1 hypothetical protein D0866_16631 [Hortaea werneckii]
MISRKSSSQLSTASTTSSASSSRKSSLSPASALTEWDADDEDTMSAEDYVPARPLSVTIPKVNGVQGPYCPRRPNLREILANTSPAPWTLAAFMAYLSNNHCLETLEFTMDAGRYRKHFNKMMSKAGEDGIPPESERQYVGELWQRLVEAYIQPNGSREVNLPSDVRDPILNLSSSDAPPAPEALDVAVAKIYELMEESVLVPFLNSAYPQSAHPTVSSCPYDTSEESISRQHGDHSKRGHRNARSSPPPQSAVEPHAHSYAGGSAMNRKSAPSAFTASLNKARFSTKLNPSTSSPAAHAGSNKHDSHATISDANLSMTGYGSGSGMTDDTGSSGSPLGESPMTPPTSPPMSDASPKRDSGMWKKLGRLSGMKVGKKKSQGGLKEEQ